MGGVVYIYQVLVTQCPGGRPEQSALGPPSPDPVCIFIRIWVSKSGVWQLGEVLWLAVYRSGERVVVSGEGNDRLLSSQGANSGQGLPSTSV
jgi:hypothetical protein